MVARTDANEAVTMNRTSMERTSDRELVITRTFNAPPRIVFEAWTKAELVSRWWAPKSLGATILSCEADVRPGGQYRYVLQARNQPPFAFSGTYSEVNPPSRLVYTVAFEPTASGPAGDPAIATITFAERDGKTDLVSHEIYPSKDVLDGVLATGMEVGMRETMDQLDELVASLR